MMIRMTDDVSRVEWGKKFDKWGIVKQDALLVRSYNERAQPHRPLLVHHVVENSVACFSPNERRVAVNLTYEEACALCAILNAGTQP